MGLSLFLFIFFPVLEEEVRYEKSKLTDDTQTKTQQLEPQNKDFSIVIPKIGATSPIIKDVNPFNSSVYQQALTKGVAHARGTSYPGKGQNIFLFSHSSQDFYQASRYNSIFYLINKLEKNDTITLYYQGEKHTYKVTEKQIISAEAVQYLKKTDKETLHLMTCWPPGTTLKRLLVTAKPISQSN